MTAPYLPLLFACASLILAIYLYVYEAKLPPQPALRSLGLGALSLSVVLYLLLGTPHLPAYPHHERTALFAPPADMPSLSDEQVRAIIIRAEEKVRTTPQEPLAWQMLARAWLMVDEVMRAEKTLQDALEHFPNSIELLSDTAQLIQSQHAQDAVPLWQRLLRVDPHHPQALWFLALHHQAQGNNTKARTLLQQLAQSNPNNPTILEAVQHQLDTLPSP
ncbi:MAG: tetratricopeptide repeat protein [Alphaproteobacteria bacterium GM202ARS2]|nr:tetratricopeptide repeat protein [Alphaproteobacteria bacterium GM202ARS2]